MEPPIGGRDGAAFLAELGAPPSAGLLPLVAAGVVFLGTWGLIALCVYLVGWVIRWP